MHHRIANKPDGKVPETGQHTQVQPGGSSDVSKSSGKAPNADTVSLTERGQMLERLEKKAASVPAIDPARIEAVKTDIANGKYRIDVDNIAEIILRSEQDFAD